MAPKAKKRKREPKKIAEIVDTEQYSIEKILENKIEGFTITYKTRWEGYSSDWDTSEAEWRMNCDEKLIDFALTCIHRNNYTNKIASILSQLEIFQEKPNIMTGVLDPLSILAQTTFQCGSVKFCDRDTIGSKVLLLEFIRDTLQYHLLHSALVPTEEQIDEDSDRYARELQYRLTVFREHPIVKINYPLETTRVFYAPPPLSTILFEPITQDMIEYRGTMDYLIPPPSYDTGFNNSCVFLDSQYMKAKGVNSDPDYYDMFAQNDNAKLVDGMLRIDYSTDPRFTAHLELNQDLGSGWVLSASHNVDVDTPLLMMTGVISPAEMAHKSLQQQGERVAFSSFIEIPNSEMCLDRRMFHDFSRYIPHSCTPTCSVRLVSSGNPYPDLVLYNLVPLNRKNQRMISLDWYGGFTKDVQKYFHKNDHPDGRIFHLYENNIDFVQCLCDVPECREVLYIDRSLKAEEKDARKFEKLADLDPRFEYRGLAVAEPKRIWEIHHGMFRE